MALSDKDLLRWRQRLQHARNVWERNGWLGTSETLDSSTRLLIELYRGNHWQQQHAFSRIDDHRLVTVNKVFSLWNTIQARVAARSPLVRLKARSSENNNSAIRATALLQYDIEEQNMLRQWNLALHHHGFAPVGIIRHGITPPDEYETEGTQRKNPRRMQMYRPARPGRPWIKAERIWNVLLDPLAETWHNDGGLKWCAFRHTATEREIRDNPNQTFVEGLGPNLRSRLLRPDELLDQSNEDHDDLIEYYSVYDGVEQTWFELTIDGTTQPIRQQDDWPIEWEQLPLDLFAVNEQMDTPIPIPLMEPVIPLQLELDRVRTIMSIVALNTRRILVGGPGITDDEFERMVGADVVEWFRAQDLQQAAEEIKAGEFPQGLILYEARIEENLRELLGQSLMDRAQRINVETAQEAGQVQFGSDLHTSRLQAAFERFITDTIRNYSHGRRSTMRESELVPILGARDARLLAEAPFLRVAPSDLKEDFIYRVVTGSTLAFEEATEAQRAIADIQVATNTPELHNLQALYMRYWEARGIDPADVMQAQQGQGGPGGDVLNLRQREQGAATIDPAAIGVLGRQS